MYVGRVEVSLSRIMKYFATHTQFLELKLTERTIFKGLFWPLGTTPMAYRPIRGHIPFSENAHYSSMCTENRDLNVHTI